VAVVIGVVVEFVKKLVMLLTEVLKLLVKLLRTVVELADEEVATARMFC
jgi:type III secretory pathway component EscS